MKFFNPKSVLYVMAVLMILIRPAVIYRTMVLNHVQSPYMAGLLLQNVPKKDLKHPHHVLVKSHNLFQTIVGQLAFALLFAIVLWRGRFALLMLLNAIFKRIHASICSLLFQVVPALHWHRRVSRLQI